MSAIRPEVAAVLEFARSQLGVREVGTNRGPQVEAYLRSVDNPPGAPWCAAYVYFSVREGMRLLSPLLPYVKSAYCPTVATWAEDLGILETTPAVGDTFLLSYGGRARHTGFVTGIAGDRVETIEGNTSLSGSVDGDGVYARDRPRNAHLSYVRWSALLPPPSPHPPGKWLLVDEAGVEIAPATLLLSRAFCSVRLWGEHFDQPVDWHPERQIVMLDGRPLPCPLTRIDGVGHAPVRALAAFAKKRVKVDEAARRIVVL